MKAITIRGVDPKMAEKLKEIASSQKKSMNQLILDILRQSMGVRKEKRYTKVYDDLDELFGLWSDSEFEQIQRGIEAQREIDPELWG